MNIVELDKLDVQAKERKRVIPNIGIDEKHRFDISEQLSKVLSDSYCLMMMTQNYLWNARGRLFRDLHMMTEAQYKNLFEAIDDLAERIRAIGFTAPGTLKELNDNTSINLPNSDLTDEEMMVDLVDSHETIVMNIRKAIGMAQKHHDYVTTDMLTSRLEYHEKVAWMMRSYFEK